MSEHRLSVVVDTPQHAGLGGALEYLSGQPLAPGTLVRVPLGRREVAGIVWHAGPAAAPDIVLRPISQCMDGLPALSNQWLALVEFGAGYYQRGLGELALAVLPPELRRLDASQLAQRIRRMNKRLATAGPVQPGPVLQPMLSDEQQHAVAAVAQAAAEARPAPMLLHGVTGSGKTEVYLRAVQATLAQGRQALMLVPEINLTPQLLERVIERFPMHRVVAMHSALTPAQRLQTWLLAHLGLADIVLGTRLGVFASTPRLGLIVVDEEHDASYKQQEGARYSARDLAVYRAHLERVPVLLGSATPSLETWQHALSGRYRRVALNARIGGAALPRVRLFDMGTLPQVKGPPPALARRCSVHCGSGSSVANRAWCSSTGAATRRCCIAPTAAGRAPVRIAARGACSTSTTARCVATTADSPNACRVRARSAAISTSSRSDAAPSAWRSNWRRRCPARASHVSTPTRRAARACSKACWRPFTRAKSTCSWARRS
jgi:primosomal protein N' (replication factor Y)